MSCIRKTHVTEAANLSANLLSMNHLIAFLALILATAPGVCRSADTGAGASPTAQTQPPRRPGNSNDVFYRLGPDSKPMDGVPNGKFIGPKVIPSSVFPGTQHTYWVYVPAQYDPAQPVAVMVFNDGQAMMAEPGDVQAQDVLDNLIFRREIPVMLGVFISNTSVLCSLLVQFRYYSNSKQHIFIRSQTIAQKNAGL